MKQKGCAASRAEQKLRFQENLNARVCEAHFCSFIGKCGNKRDAQLRARLYLSEAVPSGIRCQMGRGVTGVTGEWLYFSKGLCIMKHIFRIQSFSGV